jgi:hypothetical protein
VGCRVTRTCRICREKLRRLQEALYTKAKQEPGRSASELDQLAVRGQHRNLRHAFMQVHADVYHRFGLVFAECFGGLSEFPAYAGLGGRPTHLCHQQPGRDHPDHGHDWSRHAMTRNSHLYSHLRCPPGSVNVPLLARRCRLVSPRCDRRPFHQHCLRIALLRDPGPSRAVRRTTRGA